MGDLNQGHWSGMKCSWLLGFFDSLYSVKTVYCIHLHATLDRSSSPMFGKEDGSGISDSAVRARGFMVRPGM